MHLDRVEFFTKANKGPNYLILLFNLFVLLFCIGNVFFPVSTIWHISLAGTKAWEGIHVKLLFMA